ncbi:GGDEF domain-containing protein [Roseovarius sp. SCSIO 43702]|uniref:GGDEF domain-containing protein n=1 Tax=Roseovarius sp. SCSIO 43702 TaxID=2823043 RepID=UPI001C73C3FF|nr:GGDEF domain-containing protein [Roseovarius sp. SCSIO 43702]QYX55731.1 GGDEF domain-containing protein [Roseovarius sp. SCSIO 43702]
MQLRLETPAQVRGFAIGATLVGMVAADAIQFALLPRDAWARVFVANAVIMVCLLLPIAYLAGIGLLANHRLRQQLSHAVDHDTLTGSASRRRFYRAVSEERDWPLMVVAVDIDHFKQVNDRYGHKAGDAALSQFARCLQRTCRAGDIVARFGGEEFVILLQARRLAEAEAIAERLRGAVAEHRFLVEGRAIRLTASFGVAEVSGGEAIDAALHRADLALYRAKSAGRNRVRVDGSGARDASGEGEGERARGPDPPPGPMRGEA